jgi:hypothetical protein
VERFWLARGPCSQCRTISARRVEKGGRFMVVCNQCRAMTEHDAILMQRDGPGRTPEAAPLDALHGPGTTGGGMSRRTLVLLGLAVVFIAGGLAIWLALR